MNLRKIAVGTVEVITWTLFGIATFLLARQTWFAVQGLQPDYSTMQSAYIVAGIVTLTWLAMLGRIVLRIDRSTMDAIISLSLLLAGILIDIVVAFSVVFGFRFPAHLALLVIVAHVGAHVTQWVVMKLNERFSGNYKSPEQRIEELELRMVDLQQENTTLRVTNTTLKDAQSKLEAHSSKLEARLEEAQESLIEAQEERNRTVTLHCDYPNCNWSTTKRTLDTAERSLAAHKGMKHPDYSIVVKANGHQHVAAIQE